MSGHLDLRKMKVIPETARRPQHDQCFRFFAELYISSAEAMPSRRTSSTTTGPGAYASKDFDVDSTGSEFVKEHQCENLEPKLEPVDVSFFVRSLPDLLPKFLKLQGAAHHGTQLQPRYLQHSRLHDLYWLFLATCQVWLAPGQTPPSWSVFWRTWASGWFRILRFRLSSEHAKCNFCWKCHQLLAKHLALADKYEICMRLKEHLRMQYMDRCIYWALRECSRLKVEGVLCIIIDSMDKSKLAIPRWNFGITPKALENFVRPVVTLTAVIAHGFFTQHWLTDETIPHGSDLFLDVLLRAIDDVYTICKLEHIRFPQHLVVQSDNPTNQAKNSVAPVFLAVLVVLVVFLTATVNFLVVGHTHEDIDADFGEVCEVLLRCGGFDCPDSIRRLLLSGLAKRIRSRNEEYRVEQLHSVRNFQKWLSAPPVKLYNAFLTRDKWNEDITTPHSFAFKRRQDLFPEERGMLASGRSRDFAGDHGDVFVLTKTYMHSEVLSQPPLLCFPKAFVNHLSSKGGPSTLVERHAVSEDREKSLRKRSKLLSGQRAASHVGTDALGLYMVHAAAYYDWLLAPDPQPAPLPSAVLTEHRCLGSTLGEPSGNREFPHLPHAAWELKVAFGRRA